MKKRYLLLVLIILSFSSIFVGVSDLSIQDLFHLSDYQAEILFTSRLPRLISILIAGMGVSICGLIMQQLTKNKFVSPTTAGTLDSARLGILIAILLFPSATMFEKLLLAFVSALIGTLLFIKILDNIQFKNSIFIPLVGLMVGNIISSIATFIAYKEDLIQNMSSWLQGDFSMIISGRYELLYISVPMIFIAYLFANQFTVAGMGEDFAKNLGLNYRLIVNIGLTIVALITSAVILTVGMIPFLGLIIPNIVSLYQGDNVKKNLPHTALLGSCFILFCDILGRVLIYPFELPVGLTVGILGSGIFIYLLMRRKAYE